jgi:hypothetical protein
MPVCDRAAAQHRGMSCLCWGTVCSCLRSQFYMLSWQPSTVQPHTLDTLCVCVLQVPGGVLPALSAPSRLHQAMRVCLHVWPAQRAQSHQALRSSAVSAWVLLPVHCGVWRGELTTVLHTTTYALLDSLFGAVLWQQLCGKAGTQKNPAWL